MTPGFYFLIASPALALTAFLFRPGLMRGTISGLGVSAAIIGAAMLLAKGMIYAMAVMVARS